MHKLVLISKRIEIINQLSKEVKTFKKIYQATKDGDAIVIDVTELGYDKVLAKGAITKAFIIKAPKFSASAIEQI